MDDGVKTAVREIISTTIVNTGSYDIVERSLLEKVMQEQQFSNSGVVDDKDATEIGKLTGANKIILSVLANVGEKQMLSIKMIDVQTATVERQEVGMLSDIFSDVEKITLKIANAEKSEVVDTPQVVQSIAKNDSNGPLPGEDELVLYLPPYDGREDIQIQGGVDQAVKVFLDGEFIGGGTFAKGFSCVIDKNNLKKSKKDVHELKVGNLTTKINVAKYNYFCFETTTKTDLLGTGMLNAAQMPAFGPNKAGGANFNIRINGNNTIVYKLKIVLMEQKYVSR